MTYPPTNPGYPPDTATRSVRGARAVVRAGRGRTEQAAAIPDRRGGGARPGGLPGQLRAGVHRQRRARAVRRRGADRQRRRLPDHRRDPGGPAGGGRACCPRSRATAPSSRRCRCSPCCWSSPSWSASRPASRSAGRCGWCWRSPCWRPSPRWRAAVRAGVITRACASAPVRASYGQYGPPPGGYYGQRARPVSGRSSDPATRRSTAATRPGRPPAASARPDRRTARRRRPPGSPASARRRRSDPVSSSRSRGSPVSIRRRRHRRRRRARPRPEPVLLAHLE